MKRLAALIAALAIATSTASAEVYGRLLKVIEINPDVATLIDCNGFTWEYSDPDDMDVDDYYSAVFDDNGTEDILDDIIVDLHYERPDLF